MKSLVEKKWTTGSGEAIDFYKILKIIKDYTTTGSRVFIGTDSFVANNKTCYASALCLWGGAHGGRYFFYKEKLKNKMNLPLSTRILEETTRSVQLGQLLMKEYGFDSSLIELHLDVSPLSAGNATSKFSDMLKGYVQGYGFEFRLKPDAWASQSIADKHSK